MKNEFFRIFAMPFSLKHLALLLALLMLGACSKISLDDEDENDHTEQTDTGGSSSDKGGSSSSDGDADFLTPTEALQAAEGTEAEVRGYIVGYVAGTTISRAVFGLPETEANTNMLLADSPTETDYKKVFPVALSKTSGWREELNLFDFPENYLRPIQVSGALEPYFKVMGMREINDYQWLDEDDIDSGDDDDDEKGSSGGTGDDKGGSSDDKGGSSGDSGGTGSDSGGTQTGGDTDNQSLGLSNDEKTVDEGR